MYQPEQRNHVQHGVLIDGGPGAPYTATARGTAGSVLQVLATNGKPLFVTALVLVDTVTITPPANGAGIIITPFGTNAGETGELRFRELAANGLNTVRVKAPDAMAANWSLTLPIAVPSVGGSALVATTAGMSSWQAWVGARSVLTYGASIAINAALGNWFSVNVTDNVAHAFAAPTNPTTGQTLVLLIRNTSGGAIATATFNAAFKTAGYAVPANGESTAALFGYDATNWVQLTGWTSAIPN